MNAIPDRSALIAALRRGEQRTAIEQLPPELAAKIALRATTAGNFNRGAIFWTVIVCAVILIQYIGHH